MRKSRTVSVIVSTASAVLLLATSSPANAVDAGPASAAATQSTAPTAALPDGSDTPSTSDTSGPNTSYSPTASDADLDASAAIYNLPISESFSVNQGVYGNIFYTRVLKVCAHVTNERLASGSSTYGSPAGIYISLLHWHPGGDYGQTEGRPPVFFRLQTAEQGYCWTGNLNTANQYRLYYHDVKYVNGTVLGSTSINNS